MEGAESSIILKEERQASSAMAMVVLMNLTQTGRPKLLRHKQYFNPDKEPFDNERDSYAPLVWQCRYGGIEVPDHLWRYVEFGKGKKYSDNQAEDMANQTNVFADFDHWCEEFAGFVGAKGKVEPGKYRAYGYEAPGHFKADLKAKWREIRTGLGYPPRGSSPDQQQKLDLNKDAHAATEEKRRREAERIVAMQNDTMPCPDTLAIHPTDEGRIISMQALDNVDGILTAQGGVDSARSSESVKKRAHKAVAK